MSDWQEEYKRKSVSADEAVKCILSGEVVAIPIDTAAKALSQALIDRRHEVENVRLLVRSSGADLGWYDEDYKPNIEVIADTQAGGASAALNEKKIDFIPFLTSFRFKGYQEENPRHATLPIDVAMIVVSPPDKRGYCSFGTYLSNKKDYAVTAKKVLAEVSEEPFMMVRPPGDNYIHVSQIDCFVPHIPAPQKQLFSSSPPTKDEQSVADHVSTLIRDGDTLHLGPGLVTSSIPLLGALDERQDLGCHGTIILPGIFKLIKEGVINGKRKNIDTGKAVSNGLAGKNWSEDDLTFFDGNPMFEVRTMEYVNDMRVIASQNQMVAINGILAIDLVGQIAMDSVGYRMFTGPGGGVDFLMAAMMSKEGCSISVLRSTASRGKVSRIVPVLEEGTIVSIPRTFADRVVTEYGIANLFGKTRRQRAQELIAIAHPDFRPELKKQAEKLFG
jgi:4-hydroxybutyrate CoA-transferase